jgi:selenide,water dikinase
MFPAAAYPELLVGLSAADDAAVYRLNESQAVILTIDFFTPIVDDPYDYGAIAAANAMSDVYAMGGEVLFALNIAAFPNDLPASVIAEILRGGAEKVREAGGVIAGGHTIQDAEPKYGLVVFGLTHPDQIMIKGGARPGDKLVLTKPLGTGVITTALKRDLADTDHIAAAVMSMARLNREAAQAARSVGVRGVTDVTGFGLLGHAVEMAEASGVRLRFEYGKIPWLPGAQHYARMGCFPGGASNNRGYYARHVDVSATLEEPDLMLLYDPQTSGGLLMAVPMAHLDRLLSECEEFHQPVWVIGQVIEGRGVEIVP